jgi:hypothetical protein
MEGLCVGVTSATMHVAGVGAKSSTVVARAVAGVSNVVVEGFECRHKKHHFSCRKHRCKKFHCDFERGHVWRCGVHVGEDSREFHVLRTKFLPCELYEACQTT